MADGSCTASPAGVNQCLSNLSTGFNLVGRVGDWYLHHFHGDPILSTKVIQYRPGYRHKAFCTGYQEGSAVHVTEAEVFQLAEHL